MEAWKKRALELVLGLAITNKKHPAVVPYTPQKTQVTRPEKTYFHRVAPEIHGIPSTRLTEMLHALEKDPRVHLHNLMILCGGEVICECSAPGYELGIAHLSHSMSKTVTGMAIGMLIDDGKLTPSDRVLSFFPEIKQPHKKLEGLTVHHLLAMQSGVPFSEAGTVTETAWCETFFASAPAFEPGTKFAYNSMNSYILAEIVKRVSGKSLCEFLEERLFAPLHITNYFWEMGPQGVEKGGWGLYLSVESWAKLGQMMLCRGIFEGKRILSSDFVHTATLSHSTSPEKSGDFNYGYQIWVSRSGYEILFNGMLGQNVWVYPDSDIVVAMNAGNNELFQQSPALNIIRSYLKEPLVEGAFSSFREREAFILAERDFFTERHWIQPKKKKSGLAVLLRLKPQDPYIPAWDRLLGTYVFCENNQGILPVFIRAMQNNYSGGIESFRFFREDKHLYFTSREGGTDYTIEVGLYEYKESVLNYGGEHYLVRAMGVAIRDEDYKPVFKMELVFPEMPNRRAIKLSFLREGELLVRMDEMPNQRIATAFIESMPVTNPKMELISKLLSHKLGENFLEQKITDLFAPIFVGAKYGTTDFSAILEEQEEKLQEELARTAFLVQTFEKYGGKEKPESEEKRESILTRIVDRIKEKLKKQKGPSGIPTTGTIPERISHWESFLIEDDDHPMYSLPAHLRPTLGDGDEISEELFMLVDDGRLTLDELLQEIDEIEEE